MLAKELDLGNQTIMNQLERMGYKVANHMALVSDDVVKAIRRFYADDKNWEAAQAAERAEKEKMKPPRRKTHRALAPKRAKKKPLPKKATQPPAEEPAAAEAETAVAVEEKPGKAPAKPLVIRKHIVIAPKKPAQPEAGAPPRPAPVEQAPGAAAATIAPPPTAPLTEAAKAAHPPAAAQMHAPAASAVAPAHPAPPAARPHPAADTRQPTVRHKPKRAAVKLGRIDLRMPVEEEVAPERPPRPERGPQRPPGPPQRPLTPVRPAYPDRGRQRQPGEPAGPDFIGVRERPGRLGRVHRPAPKVRITRTATVTPDIEAPGKFERRFIKTFAKQKLVSRQKIPFLKERVPLDRIAEGRRKAALAVAPAPVVVPDKFEIEAPVTVKDLAAKLAVKASDIIRRMMMNNKMMICINDYLDAELIQLIGAEFGKEIVVKRQREIEEGLEETEAEVKPEDLVTRAPVITFLGHVDHGKTSLLDRIRKANVAQGEAGGITQHIGAYTVKKGDRRVVFLDTPGHEAFTEMRARGANVTDVVVLVVAADDGVMPQTLEAISHARAAAVPIIVALNKIDKPNANPLRAKQQLATAGLNAEEWGGDTPVVPVSATTGQGVDELVELLMLQSDLLELKASPTHRARGTVLEAKLTEAHGIVANMLVQNGTLKDGDIVVAGAAYGKVRNMRDDKGKHVEAAGPATPVSITGLSEVPRAGERFIVIDDLAKARQVAITRVRRIRETALIDRRTIGHVTLENLFARIAEGKVKELPIILKADVQGSIEAIMKSLGELSTSEVRLKFLHSAVGGISESDVMLADASDAVILGFQVVPDSNARKLAEEKNVDIRLFRIIYDLIDTVKAAMSGMLEPEVRETTTGRAAIKQVIKISRVGSVAGCMVTDGKIERSANVRLIREGIIVHESKIETLRRFKDDVREVEKGYECGIKVAGYDDVKEGDVIEAYKIEKIKREL
jgi:translation initiation factor IF-2